METNTLFKPDHEQFLVLSTLITFLVSSKSTGSSCSVWEEVIPPLAGPPPHSHSDEEIFLVKSGTFEIYLNDFSKPKTAKAGDVIFIESNALHTYKNIGADAGKMITIATPGKLEHYFREVGKVITSESEIPDLSLPPDMSKLDVTEFIAKAPEYDVVLKLN